MTTLRHPSARSILSAILLGLALLAVALSAATLAGRGAKSADNNDPTSATVPVLDFGDPAKSFVVRVTFNGREDVTFDSAIVSQQRAHGHDFDPPLLLVTLLDKAGNIIEQYNAWHPLWDMEQQADGTEGLSIASSASGRFVVPFSPNLATVVIGDIPLDKELIEVDLRPVLQEYCIANPADPDCADVNLGPLPTFAFEQNKGGAWVPYEPGTWTNASVLRAVITCEGGVGGMVPGYAYRTIFFTRQGIQTFDPASVPPCIDRAGNESDFDSYASAQLLVDRQAPVCLAKPAVIKSKANGATKNFSAKVTVTDNLDADTPVSFTGYTSSDGGGSVSGVALVGDQVSGQFLNAKPFLPRKYTLNFQATDDAGNVGSCKLTIEVN